MLAIGSVWLFTTSKRLAPRIGSLLAEKPRLIPAAVFPRLCLRGHGPGGGRAVSNETGYLKTFGLGAILGFFAYAYDLL